LASLFTHRPGCATGITAGHARRRVSCSGEDSFKSDEMVFQFTPAPKCNI
jgi:hypothetical protein